MHDKLKNVLVQIPDLEGALRILTAQSFLLLEIPREGFNSDSYWLYHGVAGFVPPLINGNGPLQGSFFDKNAFLLRVLR